ncbi:BTAD domain-containing putative transcriptional regulator [Saccharothrix australiensis]|uniref:Putative ATPase n=1 Tax=Saccharothrix australiensis TaxID=2072 RepID=A0A495W7P0_9PSEU|nr:BTAD domain-containing putative transcriptional regulator [Saccharothrix australiensis]RKT57696.1 putative ATPase [Saccharothrix australiensis]
MRFGVLGPLAVWAADGTPVRVPEVKVRALLAHLLVAEGEPVSVERLGRTLWGGRPPGNPANTLQTKVSALRRVLGRDVVTREPPGYALRVDAASSDLLDFRARLAVRDYDGALALWRGEPLAEFGDEPFAVGFARRLAEERLTAVEDRAEARLASGLPVSLADEVARHPLRERLRGLHMRALYFAGRQVEALESYADLRRRLADEQGLEPGPELVAVHRALLDHDVPRPRTNLPAAVTALVGRAGAVREVGALVAASRLVTLTGPGGVGKTRLAVEVARAVADAGDGCAWLVELAGLDRADPAGLDPVATAIAGALGIREDAAGGFAPPAPATPPAPTTPPAPATPIALATPPTTPATSPASGAPPAPGALTAPLAPAAPDRLADRVAEVVRDRELLLVLDNCERLVEPVARLVSRLLRAAPGLRVLATSQEPLGLAAETVWAVPPLDLPDAVRLFAARATAAAPGFTLGPHNEDTVAAICRRLDGLPLALELAATRVRALGVEALLDRLADRFRLLATGHRDAPPRQRTLRALIDWSWDLLTEPERTVLRRLSVTVEGCDLEAAEAICAGGDVRPDDVLDLLTGLVNRSLVVAPDHGPHPRYRLLESVSDYGRERLRDAGEHDAVRARHAAHYRSLAERADPELRGPDQLTWLRRLDADTANLRAALDLAPGFAPSLAWYWFLRGRVHEARRHLTGPWRTGFTVLAGHAVEPFDADAVTDPRARWFLGYVLSTVGDMATGERLTERAYAEFRARGDDWGAAAALCDRFSQAMTRGDFAAARDAAARAARTFAELGDRWGRLQAAFALGTLAQLTGDYAEAARVHEEGLRLAEELQSWPEVSYTLSWLGRVALLRKDFARARACHERARALAADQGFSPARVYAEIGLALGARREGLLDEAERLLLRVHEWHRQVGFEAGATLVLAERGFVAELRGDAETARALQERGLELARRTGDPRAIALGLEGLAGAEALAGRHAEAARLLGLAAAHRRSVGVPLPAAERGDVDRITAAARAALGDRRFDLAHRQGLAELDGADRQPRRGGQVQR